MPRKNPRKTCSICGGTVDEVGYVSVRGKCYACRVRRQIENNEQIELRAGPFYEHWLYRWTLAARKQIVALEASQQPQGGVQSEP